MMAVLSMFNKASSLSQSSLLHNGCALEVIMKMYRPNFYFQITEQLQGTTMGNVMTLGGRQGSGRGWVLGDCCSSPWAGETFRSSLIPFLSLPGLVSSDLFQQFPR